MKVDCKRCGELFEMPDREVYSLMPNRICGSCADDLKQEQDAWEASERFAAEDAGGVPVVTTDLF